MKWRKVEDSETIEYYRDTLGGRQWIRFDEDAKQWALTQEGYLGILGTGDKTAITTIADSMGTVDNLRIGNTDAYGFCKELYYAAARAVKDSVSGDSLRAEDGLKEVARIEAYAAILRARLNSKTDFLSIAYRAEEVSAEVGKRINYFYGELGLGMLDQAREQLVCIGETLDEMRAELHEELGDPEDKS